MPSELIYKKTQLQKSSNIFKHLHNIQLHPVLAFPIIAFAAAAVIIWTSGWIGELNTITDGLAFGIPVAHADTNKKFLRDFTSIDVMKLTKDTVTNQPSPAEIQSIVSALAQLHVKYIAVSVPLDASSDYPDGTKPFPQTTEAFTQGWADAIHKAGFHVLWRGTWSGIEGLYGFKKLVGPSRFPAGTALSAQTDGNSTWLGKTFNYILSHPTLFANGDIWAPMPERTDGIFKDTTSFLPGDDNTIQANYASFFNDLKKVSDLAFNYSAKKVYTGFTANNFSEVKSEWLYPSVYNTAGIISVDHYGIAHTPEEMDQDLRAVYKKTGQQIFLQEWSDYWDVSLDPAARQKYLARMYATFQKLSDDGILAGFNYWGGWSGGTGEGILEKTANGYALNARGQQLAQFFGNLK